MSMNEFEWMGRQLDAMQKYRDFLGRRMAAKGIDLDGVVADVFH